MHAEEFQNLIYHMEWADARVWKCIMDHPALASENWYIQRMQHYHSTQWAYGQVFLGEPISIPAAGSFTDMLSVGRWGRKFYTEYSAKITALDDRKLRSMVDFPWSARIAEKLGGHINPATIGECIVQLALHSTHHRGQVVLHLRESGYEPPLTDFIAWIWMNRPPAEWGFLAADGNRHPAPC